VTPIPKAGERLGGGWVVEEEGTRGGGGGGLPKLAPHAGVGLQPRELSPPPLLFLHPLHRHGEKGKKQLHHGGGVVEAHLLKFIFINDYVIDPS